ncbi:hypothetical protein C8Q80DRAFT_1166757 [Daedaleopsis nitida]|nr:hypothetical protein C8Q80DRAFT_1166757 [Daedaleopsis nitida]
MPNLATLTLALHTVHYYRHGISLRTLAYVLSLRRLRHLDISSISILPTPLDDKEPVLSTIAPLESFKYQLLPHRKALSIPSEARLLEHILQSYHSALQTIWLPTEPAPLSTLSSLDWPRLRELRLYGERGEMPDTPIVSLLANLTNLQVLTLNLTDAHGVEGRPIWPRSIRMSFPWPNLRRLSLSHPSAEDTIYSCLPETVQSLALRAWQHQCSRRFNSIRFREGADLRAALPLPSPHTLLRVLSDVKSDLEELEIEYRADGTETEQDLLTVIVSRFPRLSSLEIHRYRWVDDTHVPVQEIACALQPHSNLRVIKLNLDFPGAPAPSAVLWSGNELTFKETIVTNLTEFARHWHSSSLQEIWGFSDEVFPEWLVCDIVRGNSDQAVMEVKRRRLSIPLWYEPRR